MVQGINTAASGMVSILTQNDIIANNLANVNTPGFKQVMPSFKSIHDAKVYDANVHSGEVSVGSISTGSSIDATIIDFKQGAISQTDNKLDVAINGDGFFAVERNNEEYYTRNGSFSLNQEGELVTSAGEKVLGETGKPIVIDTNMGSVDDILITSEGRILQNNAEIDKLKIVDFEDRTKLKIAGNSLFKNSDINQQPVELENVAISQGYIEGSNANVIESMINSITGSRTYESLSSVVKNANSTFKLSTTQVGAISG